MELTLSKAERTRQFIIEKAAALFNTKGYAGTSLQDIMQATNLTKGCIYGHFEGKEEIALAAFEHATAHITELLRDKIASGQTATAKLEALLSFYATYALAPPIAGGCPVLNTATEADDTNPQLRASVVKVLNKLHKAIARIVTTGIAQGEFKAEADPVKFSILFVSMIEGGLLVSKLYNDAFYMQTVVQQISRMIGSDLEK